jgi:hypothetical protein
MTLLVQILATRRASSRATTLLFRHGSTLHAGVGLMFIQSIASICSLEASLSCCGALTRFSTELPSLHTSTSISHCTGGSKM